MPHGLDTDTQVFFYEQEFYVLSNFSSFGILWEGQYYATVEHAYQAEKFPHFSWVRNSITQATSAHAAYEIAQSQKGKRRSDWDEVKLRGPNRDGKNWLGELWMQVRRELRSDVR